MPKGKETTIAPQLYFIAFTVSAEGVQVQSVYTRQQEIATKLSGELALIVHSEKKQDGSSYTDSLQIFERVDFGRKKEYLAETVQYDSGTFSGAFRIDKSKIQGYPTGDQKLYEVVSVASDVWLVFKRIETSG